MKYVLFLDDEHLERTCNLSRRLCPPEPLAANPILGPTEPWESLLCAYGSVFRDESLYKAYYTLWWLDREPPYACNAEALAYSHSADGVEWTKPHLNLIGGINGGKNNLIHYGQHADQPSVLPLPPSLVGRRYALVYYGDFAPLGCGVRICFSDDGILWDWPGELIWKTAIDHVSTELDFFAADDTITWYFDPTTGKYVLVRKIMHEAGLLYDPAQHCQWTPDPYSLRRVIARCESSDLHHWEHHQVILVPDLEDEPGTEFHRLSVTPWHDQYLGLLEVYDGNSGANTIELHLIHSRDGIHWTRPTKGTGPYVARGGEGSWNAGTVFTLSGGLCLDGEATCFFGGMRARLTAESLATETGCGIGAARLQPDRFFSLSSMPHQSGLLVTKPIRMEHEVRINADIRGSLQVALLDEQQQPIAGCGWEDCHLPPGSTTDARITWGQESIPFPNQYRLGVRSQDADLFAIRID